MQPTIPERVYDPLFGAEAMTAVLSDRNFIRQMYRFEVALLQALEQNGLIATGASADLKAIDPDSLDLGNLAHKARSAGNLCIPFVKMLTQEVEKINPASAGFIHWGATSQDVIDSAVMLQLQQALRLVEDDLRSICIGLASVAETHKSTLMPGRTWLQQGPPVTLGLKVAGWLDTFERHRQRVQDLQSKSLVLQFGGAVGTLAALNGHGIVVAEGLASRLGLALPALPWHTQRDRVAEVATTLGLLVGTLGKIARDVSLLMQTEVGEVIEPAAPGRGGSSTMPHKRNPVLSTIILSAAIRVPGLVGTMLSAMVQEQERAVGGWHAEWETLTEIMRLTGGALCCAKEIAEGIQIDANAMQRDLKLLRGVTMAEAVSFALAPKIGKDKAYHILEEASQRALREGIPMLDALCLVTLLQEYFTPAELEDLLNPANYLGESQTFIDRVLTAQRGGHNAAD